MRSARRVSLHSQRNVRKRYGIGSLLFTAGSKDRARVARTSWTAPQPATASRRRLVRRQLIFDRIIRVAEVGASQPRRHRRWAARAMADGVNDDRVLGHAVED